MSAFDPKRTFDQFQRIALDLSPTRSHIHRVKKSVINLADGSHEKDSFFGVRIDLGHFIAARANAFLRRTAQRAIERRAIEAMNWGMPAVNYDLMFQAMARAGGAMTRLSIGRNFSTAKTSF
jgi:hypothetical protein